MFGESITLRKTMLILTVFSGKCVKLPNVLVKFLSQVFQVTPDELTQNIIIAAYSTRVLILCAREEDEHFVRKGKYFQLQKVLLVTVIYMCLVYCSQNESKIPLIFNNPKTSSISIRKRSPGYNLHDSDQQTSLMMSVVYNFAFLEFPILLDYE